MNKSDFLNALTLPSQMTEETAQTLEELIKNFPFSPLPYFLLARYHYQKNTPDKDRYLQIAAVHASDRKILKRFITDPEIEIHSILALSQNVEAKSDDQVINSSSLADESRDEPESESSISAQDQEDFAAVTLGIEDETEANSTLHEDGNVINEPEQKETQSDLKEVFLDLQTTQSDYEVATVSQKSDEEIEQDLYEAFTAELDDSEKGFDGKTELSRKEQDELIERFIKLRPSIIRTNLQQEPSEQEDLSDKSLSEEAEIISENLAVIMAKQGKTEKAIDIYKKLIWKYPQKKSYFADRIEELKK